MADNDLISRSALLDHTKGLPTWYEYESRFRPTKYPYGMFDPEDIVSSIENAPAVDAVEVGSCEGCYWKEIGRQQKCSCCRRNRYMKDNYRRADDG